MIKITPKQQRQINKISRKHNLKLAIVHGSYATGKQRTGSDLDIAVLGKKKLDFNDIIKLISEFGDVFGNNKEREIDLKSLHNADPLFCWQVMQHSALLYGKSIDYQEFKAFAFRQYIDHKPLLRLESALVDKALNYLKQKAYA